MDETIDVSLARVSRCIDKCLRESRTNTFTTTELIGAYLGHFHSDVGTPPAVSFNAQFGKLLKRNADELGIAEVGADERILDDTGRETSTSPLDTSLTDLDSPLHRGRLCPAALTLVFGGLRSSPLFAVAPATGLDRELYRDIVGVEFGTSCGALSSAAVDLQ